MSHRAAFAYAEQELADLPGVTPADVDRLALDIQAICDDVRSELHARAAWSCEETARAAL